MNGRVRAGTKIPRENVMKLRESRLSHNVKPV